MVDRLFEDGNSLGTPDTSLSGRRTRNARNAFTSKPSFIRVESAVLTLLANTIDAALSIGTLVKTPEKPRKRPENLKKKPKKASKNPRKR